MVEERENLGFGLNVGEFFRRERVLIDDFEGEQGIRVRVVSDTAEEDPAKITRPKKAEELEVAEVESAVPGEVDGGFDGGPVGVRAAVGAPVVVDAVVMVMVLGSGRGKRKALVEAESTEAAPGEAAAGAGGSECTIRSCRSEA